MNKLAIITGGTKGLGREISIAFAERKIPVWALYRADERAAKDLTKSHKGIETIRCDVSVENPALAKKLSLLPDTEIFFVHNAAPTFVPKPFHLFGWEEFEGQWRTAVQGMWRMTHQILPMMARCKRGTIVTVLTEGLSPAPKGFTAYLSAKGALEAFTKSLAAERANAGIKIFSVSPGFMDTELTRSWPEPLRAKQTHGQTPAEAAQNILNKIFNPSTPGHGEDHRLSHELAKTA